MSNSAFQPTVLTVPSGTSGSGGQGELNLITNPVAVTNTTGWVGAGRGTSGGPLNPTIETYFTVLNSVPGAPPYESSTSGAYDVISLPSGLQNKKLKVEFYFTSPANDTFKVSVYKGTTRVPLTTDVSGSTSLPKSTTGKFVAYFDTDSSGTWTVSITRTGGTGGTALQFTNVVVGPGIQPQGAVVGNTESVTVTGSWVANTTYTAFETRRGSWADYSVRVALTGAPTSATLTITLPSGRTIDTSRLLSNAAGATDKANNLPGSSVSIFDSNVTEAYVGGVRYGSTTSVSIMYADDAAAGVAYANLTQAAPVTFATGDFVQINFAVPIAEWAGSGTVQLAQNDVEYAWNTSTSTTASDTTSFGYGPGGATVQSITASILRRVRFQTPIQVGDSFVVEVSEDGSKFVPVTNLVGNAGGTYTISPYVLQNAVPYGIGRVSIINSTDVDVWFGQYATPSSTYGAAGSAWSSGGTAWKWRVRKSSAGAAVGFGIVQPGVSSGLVSAAGLPGNTTGNAIASGYVGEVIGSVTGVESGVISSATAVNLQSITFTTPGVYQLYANATPINASALVLKSASIFATPSSTPAVPNAAATISRFAAMLGQNSANQSSASGSVNATVTITTANTPWYLHGALDGYVSGSGVFRSAFYAVRIA